MLKIVGSLKVNSIFRLLLFYYNVKSILELKSILSINLNIVGRYSKTCSRILSRSFQSIDITNDDDTPYYNILINQISNNQSGLVFFWLEDHWFINPNAQVFKYLLDEFQNSGSQILAVSHLETSWERKSLYKNVISNDLYDIYLVDTDGYDRLLKQYFGAYLTGIPSIYSQDFAMHLLRFNKDYLRDSKHPGEIELYGDKAKLFLKESSFKEFIPKIHLFREVFAFSTQKRSISFVSALKILKIKNKGIIT